MNNKNHISIKGVYKIENLKNGKVYIGSSITNIFRRWSEHKKLLNGNRHHSKHLQSSYNIYGFENFKFEILENMDMNNKKEILDMEFKYIEKFKSFDNEFGYNVSSSTGGGNSKNMKIAVYNKDGNFLRTHSSISECSNVYKYTGVKKNVKDNKNSNLKLLSSIGLVFICFDSISEIEDRINILKKDKDIVLYSIYEETIIKKFKSNCEHKDYIENIGLKKENSSQYMKEYRIIRNTNGHVFCYIDDLENCINFHKNTKALCTFDLNGNLLSKDFSKKFTAERYGISEITINDCSKDNNNGNYKRHLRRHNGYIFKHFKISEIKNNINIINGEVIS